MIIEYLKTYFDNKEKLDSTRLSNPRGISEQRIEEIENEINSGKPFPKAFQEFLFIGGEFPAISLGPGYDTAWGLENGEDYIESINVYKKLMAKEGEILTRPFVVILSGEDTAFSFIYLDEGDDPRPRTFILDLDEGDRIVDFDEESFSKLIDRLVDDALNGRTPW